MTGSPSREAGTSGDARARRGPCLLLGVSPGGWLPAAPHQVRPSPSPSALACVPQKLLGQREPSALSPTARGRPRVPRHARTRPRRNRTAAAASGLAHLTRKPKRKRSPRRLREDEKRRTWRSGPGELLDPVPPPRGAPRHPPPEVPGTPRSARAEPTGSASHDFPRVTRFLLWEREGFAASRVPGGFPGAPAWRGRPCAPSWGFSGTLRGAPRRRSPAPSLRTQGAGA